MSGLGWDEGEGHLSLLLNLLPALYPLSSSLLADPHRTQPLHQQAFDRRTDACLLLLPPHRWVCAWQRRASMHPVPRAMQRHLPQKHTACTARCLKPWPAEHTAADVCRLCPRHILAAKTLSKLLPVIPGMPKPRQPRSFPFLAGHRSLAHAPSSH